MTTAIRLSILICALEARRKQAEKLQAHLFRQAEGKPVEVITLYDNGERTVGDKRNELLLSAHGDYVCYVDDDDWVTIRYVEGILEALASSPDCVKINGQLRTPDRGRPMVCSLTHKTWGHRPMPTEYILRAAGHLNPVKREYALATGFADMSSGEDADYAHRLKGLLHVEADSDWERVLYLYNYDSAKSATRRADSMYWNRFGGDFALTLVCSQPAWGCPAVLANGLKLKAVTPVGRGTHFLRLSRLGPSMSLAVDGPIVNVVNVAYDKPVEICLPADNTELRLIKAIDAVVSGRSTVLRYERRVP